MKKVISLLICIHCFCSLRGQTSMVIAGSTNLRAVNNVQVVIDSGSFVNNGTYSNPSGAFIAAGGITFSGTGSTNFYDFSINNSGTTILNSLVSVFNTADLESGHLITNNNLYIRSDSSATAHMLVSGVLDGNVRGIISKSTALTGPCPSFTPLVTLNIAGPPMIYHWQSSPDSLAWTGIPGATNSSYSPVVSATRYYRCGLSASNSSYNQATPGIKLIMEATTPDAGTISGTAAVCKGTSVILTDTAVGGNWISSNPSVAAADSASGIVTGIAPGTVTITYNVSTPCGTNIAAHMLAIEPSVVPSLNIVAAPGDTVCAGYAATFIALPGNGGVAPGFQWSVNGINAGTGNTFHYIPANGDVITAVLASNATCAIPGTATQSLAMHVVDPVIPAVSVINHSAVISPGTGDTLTATITNGVTPSAYQWLVNQTYIAGATSATYSSNRFANGDSVTCLVTYDGLCGETIGVGSTVIAVHDVGVRTILTRICARVYPNPNNGNFNLLADIGSETTGDIGIIITDMVGRKVFSDKVPAVGGRVNEHYDLSGLLNPGLYQLTLFSEAGNSVIRLHIQ